MDAPDLQGLTSERIGKRLIWAYDHAKSRSRKSTRKLTRKIRRFARRVSSPERFAALLEGEKKAKTKAEATDDTAFFQRKQTNKWTTPFAVEQENQKEKESGPLSKARAANSTRQAQTEPVCATMFGRRCATPPRGDLTAPSAIAR